MAEPIDVLLVGPRVAQLKPYFEVRGYRCDAFVDGGPALLTLPERRRDLVVLELTLGDLGATDFVERARALLPHAAYLLLDDASRAGQIVKALQSGVTHYLPTPPDEQRLFRDAERLVLFSRAMSGELERHHSAALAEAHAAVESARAEASNALMQSELVQQELAAANQQRENLEEEVSSLKRRVEELNGEGVASASRLDELEGRAREAEKSAKQRAARIAELETALAEQTTLAKERGAALEAVQKERDALAKERTALEERAIDLELQLDDLELKVGFLDDKRKEAEARAQEVETLFKRERLRLIEEKQHAAAGSHEAFQKMERMVDELAQLRAAKAEAEGKLRELEEKLAAKESG